MDANLSIKQVMLMTGLSKRTVYQLVKDGQLPAYKPSKQKLLFMSEEVKAYILQRAVHPKIK